MIRIAKLRAENTEKLKLRNKFQVKIDEFVENNSKVQKKLKALKKKLRDIQDLQLKKESNPDVKLTSEQKEKLKKKTSVEEEIVEVEKELEVLSTQEPPPVPSDLLDIDMNLINNEPCDDTNQNKNEKPKATFVDFKIGFSLKSENETNQVKNNPAISIPNITKQEAKNEKLDSKDKNEAAQKLNEVDEEFTTVNSKKNKRR